MSSTRFRRFGTLIGPMIASIGIERPCLPRNNSSAILTTVNQAQQYFASLVELAEDKGLIGQVLRPYQEFLRAADKWAEQNAESAKKHNDPNRLPLPDPWQFLIDAPVVSSESENVFRAAQSQLGALRHLIHIAQGIATLNKDWYGELIRARTLGDKVGYDHAVGKIADGHIIHAQVQEDVRKQNDPELVRQMDRLWQRRRAQLVHRGQGKQVNQPKRWPSWEEFRKQNGLPVVLVEWWVRCGRGGVPGLMFWRNEALTKFLKLHLDQVNLSATSIKKVRQQLGLLGVGDKDHFVWDVSVKANSAGSLEIRGCGRDGKLSFSGVIAPQKKISKGVLLSAR